MKKTIKTLVVLGVLLSIVLAACAPAAAPTVAPAQPTTAPSQPTQAPAQEATQAPAQAATQAPAPAATEAPTAVPAAAGPKRGGSIVWARNAIPESLDFYLSEANQDYWVLVNIIEPLVRVNYAGDALEGAVADTWSISDDGLDYTFHLRPGIKFSDGTLVTTDDMVFSIEQSRVTGPWKSTLDPVVSVEKVDEENIKITLQEKSASFLAILAMLSNGIIPKQQFEAVGYDEFFKNPIGTGPFKVQDWVVGDHITLAKNDNYWDMAPDGQPLPYLDSVELRAVPEDTTRVLQVQSGDADATDAISFAQVDQLKDIANAAVKTWSSTQSYYIFLNNTIPLLDDVKVRQAMNYAVDRDALVQAVLFGYGQPASSFMPPTSLCWDGSYGYGFDLDKAKQLMSESNYPNGGDLVIEVPNGRVIGRDNAIALKEMWAPLGINVTVNELEGGLLSSQFSEGSHTAISGYQWTNDVLDPDQQVQWFTVDPAFHSGWKNDRVIELAKQAAVELDQTKRCQEYSELQKLFNEDAPLILLYHTPFNTFINNDVKDFNQISLGWLRFAPVWLDR
jgi:peptide/nickel transport system substrate-binding protein